MLKERIKIIEAKVDALSDEIEFLNARMKEIENKLNQIASLIKYGNK